MKKEAKVLGTLILCTGLILMAPEVRVQSKEIQGYK